ncbi:MAG TPA: TMEM175 family protein [Thermoanaerobaculia bacterium]|nr:TMEM175 family protein [Thermoanaerobaculia bacterium]
MTKARLETFSDGVIAILITIMVLELHVPHGIPHGADLGALRPLIPLLLTYTLSFIFLAIYWNNHHHMFQTVDRVNGRILWANMHLLFWLSLVPFVTGWMGENNFAPLPTAVYGCVLLLAAIAYTILVYAIMADQGPHSKLRAAIGRDVKGKISTALYAVAIPSAFVHPGIAGAIYLTVALMWLAPDRRIESKINSGLLSHEESGRPE